MGTVEVVHKQQRQPVEQGIWGKEGQVLIYIICNNNI